jgi:hypothetical protein
MIRRIGDIEFYNFTRLRNGKRICVCLNVVHGVYTRTPQIIVACDNVRVMNSLIVTGGCKVLSVEDKRS